MSLEIYILEGFKELTSEAGTAYPSGTPPVFSGVRVTRSLVLYVCFVDRFFLLAIVLSVLLRYTNSDCPFGIFKLFFHIRISRLKRSKEVMFYAVFVYV
jgi:hypothetical protein